MKAKRAAASLLIVGSILGVASAAWANGFDFTTCAAGGLSAACHNADTGQDTVTYNFSGTTISASGFTAGSTSPNANLYVKAAGTGEDGLGITSDPKSHHEISSSSVVVLDLANLSFFSGDLTIESVQTGEGARICSEASNSGKVGGLPASMCTTITGTGPLSVVVPITWSKADPYISIIGTQGDVLVDSLGPLAVPEPGTIALLGSGLLGFAALRRRLKSRA